MELTGEPHFLWDRRLLESACARPIALRLYRDSADMATLAVGLLVGLARNHPFEQGNKRTALVSAITFLRINGYDLDLRDSREFAEIIIEVVERKRTEEELIEIFRTSVVARPL